MGPCNPLLAGSHKGGGGRGFLGNREAAVEDKGAGNPWHRSSRNNDEAPAEVGKGKWETEIVMWAFL